MENVFSLLRRDHARLKEFGPGPEGRDATRRLARDWAIHFLTEENFLFPRLASESEVRPLIRRLSETHAMLREDIRGLLADDGEGKDGGEWARAGLRDTVREAVELEEKKLFRKAERLIPPDEAVALAREVREFREELSRTLQP